MKLNLRRIDGHVEYDNRFGTGVSFQGGRVQDFLKMTKPLTPGRKPSRNQYSHRIRTKHTLAKCNCFTQKQMMWCLITRLRYVNKFVSDVVNVASKLRPLPDRPVEEVRETFATKLELSMKLAISKYKPIQVTQRWKCRAGSDTPNLVTNEGSKTCLEGLVLFFWYRHQRFGPFVWPTGSQVFSDYRCTPHAAVFLFIRWLGRTMCCAVHALKSEHALRKTGPICVSTTLEITTRRTTHLSSRKIKTKQITFSLSRNNLAS